MTVKEILAKLESLGDDARRKYNTKTGPDGTAAPDNQFEVPMGDIRALAKKIKPPPPLHELALKLWGTGNFEAQMLATLMLKPAALSADELDGLVRSTSCAQAAEWMNSYVVAQHPENQKLRQRWIKDKDRWAARAGWHLTASLVNKGADSDLDLEALLSRIEKELHTAQPEVRWTMNNTLMAIGIKHAAHRQRAITIGEKVGLYKDWPQSKGCIIPYAPVAIEALVKRRS